MNAMSGKQADLVSSTMKAEKKAKHMTMLDALPPYMRVLNALYQVNNLRKLDWESMYSNEVTNGDGIGDNIVWVSGTVITLTIPINDRILYELPSTVTVPYETVTVSHWNV